MGVRVRTSWKNRDGSRTYYTRSYGTYLTEKAIGGIFGLIFKMLMLVVYIAFCPFYTIYWLVRYFIEPWRQPINGWVKFGFVLWALLIIGSFK